jgi:hypothetical protein
LPTAFSSLSVLESMSSFTSECIKGYVKPVGYDWNACNRN